MNMPGMPRLAARNAFNEGRQEEEGIKKNHQLLTRVFGGEYWKDILLHQSEISEAQKLQLIQAYRDKLSHHLPFADFCPVREHTRGQIKYFIVFASRHPHALAIFNDAMLKAYHEGMHEADTPNSLWSWQDLRSISELDHIIIEIVDKNRGKTREAIWFKIVQSHFMKYLYKEYRARVQRLVDDGKLVSPTPRKTKSLNDNCTLFLP